MLTKLIMMTLGLFTLIGCMRKQPIITPIPEQLVGETVAFVSPDHDKEWTIDCGGVWVAPDLILTAYHCTVEAKKEHMSAKEMFLYELTGEMPDSTYAPLYFATNEQFDVLEKGATKHYNAIVIAIDRRHDLALVRAFDAYPPHRVATLATVDPKLGDEISTMGHPAGISYSYTRGYVSGFHSGIDPMALDLVGPFIKINAVIVGGNSGGGVFNSSGQLIGIVSFTNSRAVQQGFIIPLGSVRKLLEDYEKNKKK